MTLHPTLLSHTVLSVDRQVYINYGEIGKFIRVTRDEEEERVGILTGRLDREQHIYIDKIHYVRNVSPRKYVHFIVHPQDLFNVISTTDLYDPNSPTHFCGLIHTHPNGTFDHPSATDMMHAKYTGVYMILAVKTCSLTCWWNDGTSFKRQEYILT